MAKKNPNARQTNRPAPKEGRDDRGLFSVGNNWWQIRASSGINPTFKHPEELLKVAGEYFDWLSNNPLKHHAKGKLQVMNPATMVDFCGFIGISHRTWQSWKHEGSNNFRPDLLRVIHIIEDKIRDHKFKGAAVGFFNATIISRDLGLTDKQDITSGGEPIQKELDDRELAITIAFMLSKGIDAEGDDG